MQEKGYYGTSSGERIIKKTTVAALEGIVQSVCRAGNCSILSALSAGFCQKINVFLGYILINDLSIGP